MEPAGLRLPRRPCSSLPPPAKFPASQSPPVLRPAHPSQPPPSQVAAECASRHHHHHPPRLAAAATRRRRARPLLAASLAKCRSPSLHSPGSPPNQPRGVILFLLLQVRGAAPRPPPPDPLSLFSLPRPSVQRRPFPQPAPSAASARRCPEGGGAVPSPIAVQLVSPAGSRRAADYLWLHLGRGTFSSRRAASPSGCSSRRSKSLRCGCARWRRGGMLSRLA